MPKFKLYSLISVNDDLKLILNADKQSFTYKKLLLSKKLKYFQQLIY